MIKKSHEFINDLDKLKLNTQCPITGREFTEEDCKNRNIIMLECNHAFLYNNFMISYNELNKDIFSYRKCPYCMCDIHKVPFKFKINT
jgi:hypothetical protein|tara:strand:- start:327 stop:590 length:264 start_codon:yes stop_codon:yes gene_type:complete